MLPCCYQGGEGKNSFVNIALSAFESRSIQNCFMPMKLKKTMKNLSQNHEFARLIHTDHGRPPNHGQLLDCVRATQIDEFCNAFQITHDSYSQRGYIYPNATGLWMTRHHLLGSTRVFISRGQRRSQGTLTLVNDGPAGLPMETLFRSEVEHCREQQGSIAEATCMALEQRGTATGNDIVNRLMGIVAQSARRSAVTQILIAVHPRHAKYYHRMAGFQPIGQPKPYPAVRGHLAVPLVLHLPTLKKVCPTADRRYFEMNFSSAALHDHPTSDSTTNQLTSIWERIRRSTGTVTSSASQYQSVNKRAA